jgi:hypothetical protein
VRRSRASDRGFGVQSDPHRTYGFARNAIHGYFQLVRLTEATMRYALPIAVAAAFLSSAPILAAKAEASSWGKPGVSIDQYRMDAITCGRAGYYADVSDTQAAKTFKRATGELESNESDLSFAAMDPSPTGQIKVANIVNRSTRIVEGTRPGEQMKDVRDLMQAKVDDCLKGRGYVRFRLTDAQRKRLAHLHLGSPERHIYLHQLATDPAVLKVQAM